MIEQFGREVHPKQYTWYMFGPLPEEKIYVITGLEIGFHGKISNSKQRKPNKTNLMSSHCMCTQ